MKRIVLVQQKEQIISRSILGRRDTVQVTRKDPERRENGSFLEESNLKEKLQRSILYAED